MTAKSNRNVVVSNKFWYVEFIIYFFVTKEFIKPPTNTVAPKLIYFGKRMREKFNRRCLKQDKITFNFGKIVNIVHILNVALNYNENIALESCLLVAVKLTKNADINKYKYSGYSTGFDEKGAFSKPIGRFGVDIRCIIM